MGAQERVLVCISPKTVGLTLCEPDGPSSTVSGSHRSCASQRLKAKPVFGVLTLNILPIRGLCCLLAPTPEPRLRQRILS